ncbi:MAG TPA: hypothetical protein VGI39_18400 [Polyangiaceae bacterium]|jgi:hypothetical protein
MKSSLTHTLLSLTISCVAALGFLPGCGGGTSTEASGTGLQGTGVFGGKGSVIGQESCSDLQAAAQKAFGAWSASNTSCSADSDCTSVTFTEASFCAAACGAMLNTTGAASAVDVATQACSTFDAQGCPPPEIPCPATGAPICAGGTCAGYRLSLDTMGPFVHGTCTTLRETYAQPWAAAPAPHDFTLALTSTNGTFYADGNCTTPLTALTIPKGSSVVTFGFLPAAAGPFAFTVGSDAPGEISGNAE